MVSVLVLDTWFRVPFDMWSQSTLYTQLYINQTNPYVGYLGGISIGICIILARALGMVCRSFTTGDR